MERANNSSQVFCLSWVKRGAAKSDPEFIQLSAAELDNSASDEDSDEAATSGGNKAAVPTTKNTENTNGNGHTDTELDEYDLDNYDDDEDDVCVKQGFQKKYVYSNNADDPYLTKGKDEAEVEDSGDEEERAASIVKPEDNLLLCARCSQHSSVLEVFVYNHSTKDFYVHHDIPLQETPLCMQWIGFDPGAGDNEMGNLVALGNLNSTIDIWDVDLMNTMEPILTIGHNCNAHPKVKKNRKFRHTDAILDLSWSDSTKDNLASASADGVVALWDLEMAVPTNVFKDHVTKVQSIEWQPRSTSNLCSGSFDGKVYILDKKSNASTAEWQVDGEVERISWNQHDSNYFVVGTDKGMAYYFDFRKPNSNVLEWKAHEQPIPCLSIFTIKSETFLSTGSSDGFAKIWDLGNAKEKIPDMIFNKDMKIGMVHCSQVNPDESLVIAYGGQKDAMKVWDLSQTSNLASRFGLSELSDGADTLNPEGGGGGDDDEVSKYIDGVDYYVGLTDSELQ